MIIINEFEICKQGKIPDRILQAYNETSYSDDEESNPKAY